MDLSGVFDGICQPVAAYSQEEISYVIVCYISIVCVMPYTSEL